MIMTAEVRREMNGDARSWASVGVVVTDESEPKASSACTWGCGLTLNFAFFNSPGAEEYFPGARVPSVVPHIVGIVFARGFQNYRGPRDWCRMTRLPDIGSRGR